MISRAVTPPPVAGIVIPAHNEGRSITRLLDALTPTTPETTFEITVVCNGCTDDTAVVARGHAVGARVLEIEQPSKKVALRVGDEASTIYPRLFIDADVEITAADVALLVAPLTAAAAATAPRRVIPRDGVAWPVRWYYDVWEQLPQVRAGLFGRGVVALSEAGNARVRALPPAMSDDLVMSEAFADHERVVVEEAAVVVRPPRTMRDLIRRRVRVTTGNSEADRKGLRGDAARTTPKTLLTMMRKEPRLVLRMPIFVTITVISTMAARRAVRSGDVTTWHRDESSRQ